MKVPDQIDRNIIDLLAEGYTDKEIADKVFLSVWAVNKRVERLKEFYECRNRVHLIAKLQPVFLLHTFPNPDDYEAKNN